MAAKKKKRGRPPIDSRQARTESVLLRLQKAEKDAFSAAARLDGKKLSEWLRDRLRRLSREELQAAGLPDPFLSGIAGKQVYNKN